MQNRQFLSACTGLYCTFFIQGENNISDSSPVFILLVDKSLISGLGELRSDRNFVRGQARDEVLISSL